MGVWDFALYDPSNRLLWVLTISHCINNYKKASTLSPPFYHSFTAHTSPSLIYFQIFCFYFRPKFLDFCSQFIYVVWFQLKADMLAYEVSLVVFNMAGGVGQSPTRPKPMSWSLVVQLACSRVAIISCDIRLLSQLIVLSRDVLKLWPVLLQPK